MDGKKEGYALELGSSVGELEGPWLVLGFTDGNSEGRAEKLGS